MRTVQGLRLGSEGTNSRWLSRGGMQMVLVAWLGQQGEPPAVLTPPPATRGR